LKRGAGKIKGIGLLFRGLDYECRGYLTFDQFYPGILERCVDFTPDEVKLLFVEFDRDNSGIHLDFDCSLNDFFDFFVQKAQLIIMNSFIVLE